jgi:hypothetical protein
MLRRTVFGFAVPLAGRKPMPSAGTVADVMQTPSHLTTSAIPRAQAQQLIRGGSREHVPYHSLIASSPSWQECLEALGEMRSAALPITPETVAVVASRALQEPLLASSCPVGSRLMSLSVNAAAIAQAEAELHWERPDADFHEGDEEEGRAGLRALSPTQLLLAEQQAASASTSGGGGGGGAMPRALASRLVSSLVQQSGGARRLPAECWRDLCLLPQQWYTALAALATAAASVPGEVDSATVAGTLANCLGHPQGWAAALRVYQWHRGRARLPSADVAFYAAKAALHLPPGHAAAAELTAALEAELREAAEDDDAAAVVGAAGTSIVEAVATALAAAGKPVAALRLIDSLDAPTSPSHKLLVPSANGYIVGAAAALSGRDLERATGYLKLWGQLDGARWPSVGHEAMRVFWRALSDSSGDRQARRLAVALAARAARDAERCTYPQLRPIMHGLARVATRGTWTDERERTAAWMAACALFHAADGATLHLHDSFIRSTSAVLAWAPTPVFQAYLAHLTPMPTSAAAARSSPSVALAQVSARRGDWVAAIASVRLALEDLGEDLHATTNSARGGGAGGAEPGGIGFSQRSQLIHAALVACARSGAWRAAFVACKGWLQVSDNLHDLPPWAAKSLWKALVAANRTDAWQAAVAMFALSSPLSGRERTHLAGYLARATVPSSSSPPHHHSVVTDPSGKEQSTTTFVETLLSRQALLRIGVLGRHTRPLSGSVDDAVW